jgi:hypothetical protein
MPECRVFVFDADYALWFIPERREAGAIGSTIAGAALNAPGSVSLSTEHLEKHMLSGARLSVGYFLADADPWMPGGNVPYLGAEARFFFVGQRSIAITDQSPIIVRPFFDLNTGQPSFVPVAAPGFASGTLTATAKESLWGAEANVWANAYCNSPGTTCAIDIMAGARYLDLDESADVGRFSSFVAHPAVFPGFASFGGNQIVEHESFAARNHFYGAQFGVRGRMDLETLVVSGYAQLALGATDEEISIRGNQVRTLPGGQTIVSQGALLALPSNIGRFNRDKFSQVPEFGASFEFPIVNHLTLAVGVSALYWSRIVRVEDQLDRGVDVTQIPSFPGAAGAVPTGLNRPAVPFRQSDVWLLGGLISAKVTW